MIFYVWISSNWEKSHATDNLQDHCTDNHAGKVHREISDPDYFENEMKAEI
jgi:hypothetical protein